MGLYHASITTNNNIFILITILHRYREIFEHIYNIYYLYKQFYIIKFSQGDSDSFDEFTQDLFFYDIISLKHKMLGLLCKFVLPTCLCLLHLATDDTPPPCSVLCHMFQILPSITLYLHLSNKISPPGISWSSSSTLSLRVPL